MISTKINFKKKQEKEIKKGVNKPYISVHDNDDEAADNGMVLIDEFEFPHVVYKLTASEMN